MLVIVDRYPRMDILSFMLSWERQRSVRKFMNRHTENIARYPNIERIDYFGHSYGSYILASALQQYETLSVNHVLYGGSVVPQHYDWKSLIEAKPQRVRQVLNIVANDDRVVALFPQLHQTISMNWLHQDHPKTGALDVGAAGFRGFNRPTAIQDAVRNIKFATGGHSAILNFNDKSKAGQQKLLAIANYLAHGDDKQLSSIFASAGPPVGWINVASNLSWAVWLAILISIGSIISLTHRLYGLKIATVATVMIWAFLSSV